MRHQRISSTVLACCALVLGFPALSDAQPDTGSADFSTYVALGDSLTAGFASGGLAESEQRTSYPALLHGAATGDAEGFEQPLVSEPGIPPQLVLRGLFPTLITPASGQGQPLNLNLPRPYDNLGVPGADVHDTIATVTDDGGLHDLILRGLGTALQQALALDPTFVTVWIGNNDVLAAATSGIVIDGVTLTPTASFEADFTTLIEALSAREIQLAIATIPQVTAIPFVTTIPPVVVDPATGEPVLVDGETVPLIGPGGPLSEDDHVLLSASSFLALGFGIPVALGGSGDPLPNEVVLDAAETAAIEARTTALNQIIAAAASEAGAALVDTNALFRAILEQGLVLGGVEFSADFLTGGLFSYDGVHPTPLAYGVVANAFVGAINATYGARIPSIDLFPLAFEGDPRPLGGAVGSRGAAPALAGSGFLFSEQAWQNLRFALGLDRLPSMPGEQPDDDPQQPGERPTPLLPRLD